MPQHGLMLGHFFVLKFVRMKLQKKVGLILIVLFFTACSSGVSSYKKRKKKPKNKKKCDCPSFSQALNFSDGKMSENDILFDWGTQI